MIRPFIAAALFGCTLAAADAQTIGSNLQNFLSNARTTAGPAADEVGQINDANCAVQAILRDALYGKDSGQIDYAIRAYANGGKALIQKAENPSFARKLNMQGWKYSLDTDLSNVQTRADLLRLIGQQALDASSDLRNARDHGDVDALKRAIERTGNITRLILAFIDIPLA